MRYEVISRFFHREQGVYVNPGASCPRLSRATADRLVKARCIVRVEGERKASKSKAAGSKKSAEQPASPAANPAPAESPKPPPASE